MSIQYAILGLLSREPLSGYDLKKIIASTDVFYWSGNSNQIYTSLSQLHRDGLVTQEVQFQESLPAKKIYSITAKGRAALRDWVLKTEELPEFRSTFLVQLAGAEGFSTEELDNLMRRYEEEIHTQLHMQQENARRLAPGPARSPQEQYLWERILLHQISLYQTELEWIQKTRQGIK